MKLFNNEAGAAFSAVQVSSAGRTALDIAKEKDCDGSHQEVIHLLISNVRCCSSKALFQTLKTGWQADTPIFTIAPVPFEISFEGFLSDRDSDNQQLVNRRMFLRNEQHFRGDLARSLFRDNHFGICKISCQWIFRSPKWWQKDWKNTEKPFVFT